MLQSLQALASAAVGERVTLLLNHVIAAEPAAQQRLLPHAGRTVDIRAQGWPTLLPPLPPAAFRVTPAGLLEWLGAEPPATPELRVEIDASNPALALARSLGGERPKVEIAGDAQFAADVSWLFEHLRWDVQDDLARLVGDAPARELARLGGAIAAGLREAVRTIGSLASRLRGGPGDAPPPPR